MKKITGFTLLELLIVVVIVGVLAALAIPAFRKSAESSKATEAYNNLNAIRKAEWTYYTKHECITYDINDLSIENPNNIPSVSQGGNRCFSYSIVATGMPQTWAIDAFRNSGPYVDCSIRMDANGNIDESNWIQ